MDEPLTGLIARGDLDGLGAFFEEHQDYGESNQLVIDSKTVSVENAAGIVSLLLSNGAELEDDILHHVLGNKELAELLLQAGADVNFNNEEDESPLAALLNSEKPSAAMVQLFVRHGAHLADAERSLIRRLLDTGAADMTVQDGVELEALLASPDQRPKHTRVENWLNQAEELTNDAESSVDSLQSLNEDIRSLRCENHKLRNQLKLRETELFRKNERIRELEQLVKRHHHHHHHHQHHHQRVTHSTATPKSKSAFISMKI